MPHSAASINSDTDVFGSTGGNDILLENHIGRFVADAEAIYSQEDTQEMNALTVGKPSPG